MASCMVLEVEGLLMAACESHQGGGVLYCFVRDQMINLSLFERERIERENCK